MGKSSGKRQYNGVRRRSWGSWVSEIRAPLHKTRIWLGSYSTPEAAARAYDAALLCLKGSSAATFNFPAALPRGRLIAPAALSPKSIQKLAAAAAAANSPSDSDEDQCRSVVVPASSSSTMTATTTTERGEVVADEAWVDLEPLMQSPKDADDQYVAVSSNYWPEDWEELAAGDINLWNFC
ncbi:ethylene-responsive transcription factor ERF014-like [Curcuma longa]|uniref:ethylene-responsive transcription factor ERF014-like n=1 Tax=Curcuma longa TaxID=136217 RepID=UPI003D9DE330